MKKVLALVHLLFAGQGLAQDEHFTMERDYCIPYEIIDEPVANIGPFVGNNFPNFFVVEYGLTIEFMPESAVLDPLSEQQLSGMLGAREDIDGYIGEVQVAVWSDLPMPTRGEKLPEEEILLSKERGEAIRNFINENFEAEGIHVYNMATSIADVNTGDGVEYRLKSLDPKLRTRDFAADPKMISMWQNGGPSTATITIKTK